MLRIHRAGPGAHSPVRRRRRCVLVGRRSLGFRNLGVRRWEKHVSSGHRVYGRHRSNVREVRKYMWLGGKKLGKSRDPATGYDRKLLLCKWMRGDLLILYAVPSVTYRADRGTLSPQHLAKRKALPTGNRCKRLFGRVEWHNTPRHLPHLHTHFGDQPHAFFCGPLRIHGCFVRCC